MTERAHQRAAAFGACLACLFATVVAACGSRPDRSARRTTSHSPPDASLPASLDAAVIRGEAGAASGSSDAQADGAAGLSDASRTDSGECDECVGRAVGWALEGGLVAYRESSRLEPCRTYAHLREPPGDASAPIRCARSLHGCMGGDRLGVYDVAVALAHPEVEAALRAAPVVYGRDLRPADNPLFVITVDDQRIAIGAPCSASPGCVELPGGVRALADLLEAIDTQELARAPCAGRFR